MPGMRSEALFDRVTRRVRSLGLDCEFKSELVRTTPALLTPPNTPLAKLLDPLADPGPESATFATDGGNLRTLGMQPLIFGPGSINVAHKADEYVDVSHLHRAVDVLTQLIAARCEVGRP